MKPDWRDYIKTDPAILVGKPAIVGTRIGVDLVLEKMAMGSTIDQILDDYPHLNRLQIQACLAYATDAVRNDIIFAAG